MENCFLALSFHNNKVFLTLNHCSFTLGNLILTLENFGPRVNDSWDSDSSENLEYIARSSIFCKVVLSLLNDILIFCYDYFRV